MTYTKKSIILFIICILVSNKTLLSYPILGEFYKSSDNHNILILVDNSKSDNITEKRFKSSVIPYFKKILSDNEINIILENRLEQIVWTLQKNINAWSTEFESDPKWNSVVEQNYSSYNTSQIQYKKTALDPKSATKFFVLVSNVKNYLENLSLKEHLNFVRKIGTNKDNNLFNSCRSTKDYFRLDRSVKAQASITLADWRTPTIMNITQNYQNGLVKLSQDLHLIEGELQPDAIEDLARAFVPQHVNAIDFKPEDKLSIKNLLDDIELILKKLDQLQEAATNESDQELWSIYRNRIQKAKEYILDSVTTFKNLPLKYRNNFEQLFKGMPKYQYAQLHWFAIIYAQLLKNGNSTNSDENNEWAKILTKDLVEIGLLNAILESKSKKTKALVYLNEDSYKAISQKLLSSGYAKTLVFNNNDNNHIKPEEFGSLANEFPVNVLRIKQLMQKPVMCSFRI